MQETARVKVGLKANFDDPALIGSSLAACCFELGIVDDVRKSLKAPTVENFVPEAAMRWILHRAQQRMAHQWSVLRDNLGRFIDVSTGRVQKSGPRDPRELSEFQLEQLREMVRAHFAGGMTPDLSALWQQYGLAPADWGFLLNSVQEAYVLGKVADLSNLHALDMSFEHMMLLAQQRPMLRQDVLAVEASKRSTREHLRKIGDGVTNDVVNTINRVEARKVSDVINRYMGGELEQTKYHPEGGELSEGAGRWAATESDLKSELYSYFKNDPNQRARDWTRVAITETRSATNIGRLMKLTEDGWQEFYFLVQPDACQLCRRTYLEADGSPKVFTVRVVLAHALATTGVNIAKEHQGIPNAVLHPHCNCLPLARIPRAPMIVLGGNHEMSQV